MSMIFMREFTPAKEIPKKTLKLFGGGTQIRTGGRGFADLGLTTWLCRQEVSILKDLRLKFNQARVCHL